MLTTIRYLLFIGLFLLAGKVFSQKGSISGYLVIPNASKARFAQDGLVSMKGKQGSQVTTLDKNFTFRFSELTPDTVELRIIVDDDCYDTIIRDVVVLPDANMTVVIKTGNICEYDRSKNDPTCPVCHQNDQTIPVIYGLLVVTKKRKKNASEDGVDFIGAGCETTCCDPNWYCKRDKHYF